MKLEKIRIRNYRSINDLEISIDHINDGSYTYGLIGVNEAGKSSILKALALKDNYALLKLNSADFFNNQNIIIDYTYTLNETEYLKCSDLIMNSGLTDTVRHKDYESIILSNSYDANQPSVQLSSIQIINLKDSDSNKKAFEQQLLPYISEIAHKSIIWSADQNHLISSAINFNSFISDPSTISIPLKNCFTLAGFSDVNKCSNAITDSTEREFLRNKLSQKVTDHIRRVWPNHPIKITFDISDGYIYFHVNDEDTTQKAKTASQRSDGFRQFISFLLTLSAENINSELENTLILLDEPETHLHPKAQEDLLNELVLITKNNKNNIVFFATHSNYMVDKYQLDRNYKVLKEKDETKINQFDSNFSSYASVNYDAFEIKSTDYHNELYGYLQEKEELYTEKEFEEFLFQNKLKKDQPYTKIGKDGIITTYKVTLPTKIRNIIHHPENKNNNYSELDLEISIKQLIKLKDAK